MKAVDTIKSEWGKEKKKKKFVFYILRRRAG